VSRPPGCERIALVLQGGGALGAYQAGVFQALEEHNIAPDFVAGVSIGAINAAIIAGNPPERRLERLRSFWNRITDRSTLLLPEGDGFRTVAGLWSTISTIWQGQAGFFAPHRLNAWLAPRGTAAATSFYDTEPLRRTLTELVDFELLKRGPVRLAVGAVQVDSGNLTFFDSATQDIGPQHIMASGALPPALPMVQVGTDYFWDGGIVSNTPLQYLLESCASGDSLVFQVDLFPARGPLPRDISGVLERQKDIQYSSRTRYTTDMYKQMFGLKQQLFEALSALPEASLTDALRQQRDALRELPEYLVFQLIYQQKSWEGQAKDYEFSAATMQDHWRSGYEDTKRTLNRHDWMVMPPHGTGITTHDVHRED
jgi:NTE family protein